MLEFNIFHPFHGEKELMAQIAMQSGYNMLLPSQECAIACLQDEYPNEKIDVELSETRVVSNGFTDFTIEVYRVFCEAAPREEDAYVVNVTRM